MTKCILCGSVTGNKAEWKYKGIPVCSVCKQDFSLYGVSELKFSRIRFFQKQELHHRVPDWQLTPIHHNFIKGGQ